MPSTWPLLLPLLMANVLARPTPLPSSPSSPNSCRMPQPLGMESGAIGDDQLSASSSFDEASLGPAMARIRGERGGGAWCPDRQIHVDSYEFVQVDLLAPFEIWAVEVQGRYGNGSGREFAEALMLDYIGPARRNWTRYTASDSNETVANQLEGQVLPANEDERTAELIPLVPPMLASSIRLVPFSAQLRTVCIRFELWGCPILMSGTPGDAVELEMEGKREGESANIGQYWSRHILERPALLYSLAVLLALLPLGLFLLLLRRLLQFHRKSSSSLSSFFSCSSSRTSSTATQSALRPSSSWQNVLLPFPFDNSMPGASAKIFSPSFCRFDTVSMGWPSLRRAPGSILGREMSDRQPKNVAGEEEGIWANGLGENGISAGGPGRRAQSFKAMAGQGQQKMGRKRQQPMLPAVPVVCPTVRATVHQLAHSCSQPESFVTRPRAPHPQNGRGGKKPMPKPRSILLLNQQQQNGIGMHG